MAVDVVHGLCAECEQPVLSGDGVTVDPQGQVWHPDCRRVWRRKNQQQEKRGPGRPRKTDVEVAA